ncbi:hypothetical protein BDA96_04G203600 [Sorghum bicolor]|jgi:hypothetical protein|uniref:Uncharacterized protein n=2 Tax=Sorghum bicolor TaxID=4558 RepID=A0A921UJA2_SORBI|nr:uncharacterized protein LOC110435001 [Sorghum bicolor]KAG0533559.1 hypothetical protein BDA96_04G203600 [Sorghum bicolor]KXG30496.1 hypothetical protein SORBI_3004G191400 [Sorghum bicolor]|eukprot:XP_021315881.1 uncharacterized protein LOC110435001 [Sorghum bicolor]
MAPRSRLLDLERHDVLFFYGDGAYHHHHQSDRVSVATYGIVFWPVFLVAALLLKLIVPFPHAAAAAVCWALYVAYCFLLNRAAQASSSSSSAAVPPAEPSRPTTRGSVAGYMIEQRSQ